MYQDIGTFLIMLIGGIFIGIFYDLYRRFWLKKYNRNWRKHLGDIIFSFFISSLILALLFYSNWGEIRSYIFMGIGLGILTYFKIIKGLVRYFRLK